MVGTKISGVKLAGIASAVPERVLTLEDGARVFGEAEIRKIRESTGVRSRHVISPGICTSDLCFAAAERLLADMGWNRDSVDALIFVSQTPDYFVPATSCSLQARLGLAKHCAAFDVNLGCSGYIYGLWLASQLMAGGSIRRLLLLVGDTSSFVSPLDRSTAMLFGDAGTVTALERDDNARPWVFEVGTDGNGQNHLIVPAGGRRQPSTESTRQRTEREGGNIRSDEDLFMNGAEVFAFTLREVPPLVKSVLSNADWSLESVDAFVMHQANRFMLHHLAKKMKLPMDKVVVALEEYGNTSSASVPLAMTHALANKLKSSELRLLLAGFGVGWSWGAVALTCGLMVMPELVVVPNSVLLKEKLGVAL